VARCHWHPKRSTETRCDVCDRPVCSTCATQLAKETNPYWICPECLERLEDAVDREFERETEQIDRPRVLLGAITGATVGLAMWIGGLFVVPATYTPLVAWSGVMVTALLTAGGAIRIGGNRRGWPVVFISVAVVVLTTLGGYYLTTNTFLVGKLVENPELLKNLTTNGGLPKEHGVWLPPGIVISATVQLLLDWMNLTAIATGMFLTYTMTHRRRVFRASKVTRMGGPRN
jgi:hypothetical protein